MKEKIINLGISFGEIATELEILVEEIFNEINLFSDETAEETKEDIDFLPEMGGFENKMFDQILEKAATACTTLISPSDQKLVELVVYFFTEKMLATFLESYEDYANDLARLEKRAKTAPHSMKGYKYQILVKVMDYVKKR